MDARNRKKPGETAFAFILTVVSLGLFYKAYEISGFEALSSPGALPMAAAFTMVVASALVLIKTIKANVTEEIQFWEDILPPVIIVVSAFILVFAIILKPLGFIPSAFLFLFVGIYSLRKKGLLYCLGVSAFSLIVIYILFRLVFTVLMPEGIVPERDILAFIEGLFSGEAK